VLMCEFVNSRSNSLARVLVRQLEAD